jgi:hypothetical protein
MSRDNMAPNRKARIIALSAVILAVVGGLSLFDTANGETETPAAVAEPATVIATGCSGFEADAHELFDKHSNAVLKGTFAPGDHVHLAIDLRGAGYSWELTGVSEGPHFTPSLPFILFKTTKWHSHTTTTFTRASGSTPVSTVYDGEVNGYARWQLEFDVATAGEGAITIKKTSADKPSSLPFLAQPGVAIASCNASTPALKRMT